MSPDHVVWRTAHPLWRDGAEFTQPALLRLAGDDFMEQLQAALAMERGLSPLVAGAETWRTPGAGPAVAVEATEPITLFQPTHGRFYLVLGALVCRRYGHPDHAVRPNDQERIGLVLRRLVPVSEAPADPADPSTFVEHGWVPSGNAGRWQPAPDGEVLADEERLPVFPTTCIGTPPRRTWSGLVPVSRREVYEPPPVVVSPPGSAKDPLAVLADPRLQELEVVVAGLQLAARPDLNDAGGVRESLFFTMADLQHWLDEHLDGGAGLNKLDRTFLGRASWRTAIATAAANEAAADFDDTEPAPVAGLSLGIIRDAVAALEVSHVGPPTTQKLFTTLHGQLPPRDASQETARSAPSGPGIYVARLFYERPRCTPAQRNVLSAPSRPFRLASFYHPDAPARPVQIAMPIDTSPGGLRKFPRSVSMVLSSELRKQMSRVSEDTLRDDSLEDPPQISFGMVCQLSIPIIAICALLLLMVVVAILNIVFFWMPLFKVCLPMPKEE